MYIEIMCPLHILCYRTKGLAQRIKKYYGIITFPHCLDKITYYLQTRIDKVYAYSLRKGMSEQR